MIILARWESRGGAHYVELHGRNDRYSYRGNGCGGSLGPGLTDAQAVAIMQARVDAGYFLPDSAKVPMVRVGPILSKVLIVAGPTYFDDLTGNAFWEVIVGLPVCNALLVRTVFNELPQYADFDGRVYCKHGVEESDCIAYYRSYER